MAESQVRSERIFLMAKISKYELLYIVHPDLESSIDKITERVHNFITNRDGKVTYEENWGKRKLAYEIKKNQVGIYILTYFEAPTEALAKVERDLRLTEEIIRFMVMATTDKVKAPATKEEKPVEEPKEEKAKEVKKAAPKKTAKKAEEPKPEESEEDRMKKLNEKLGEILGEEEDNKEEVKAKAKTASKGKKAAEKE